MPVWLKILLLLLVGELVLHPIFHVVSILLGKQKRDKLTLRTIFKGLIERTFVVIVLCLEVASALTLLGALKIATRIKDDEDKVSNDFFLAGNLISILFGFLYFVILRNLSS